MRTPASALINSALLISLFLTISMEATVEANNTGGNYSNNSGNSLLVGTPDDLCAGGTFYKVFPRDTCWAIRTRSRMPKKEFCRLNPNVQCGVNLLPDTRICLGPYPYCARPYHIKLGDSCISISRKKRMSRTQLLALNPFLDCKTVQPNQFICLI